MPQRRPEREKIEQIIKEGKRRTAYDIAGAVGLIDTMGYDKAVTYVKQVRRTMRKRGDIPQNLERFGTDEGRLADITKLFEIRQGKMSEDAAYFMLLLNCYYRLRSENDVIHLGAIDDTYQKNAELETPHDMRTAVSICEIALARYVQSKDEGQIELAKKRGLPCAGFCYANETLIDKLEITDEELEHMESIRRDHE